jgi:integrase
VATSPDYSPLCSPDSGRRDRASLDSSPDHLSGDPFAVGLGAAVDLFLAAKAAEGASPSTVEWYRMIVGRAVRRFGSERPVDRVGAAELRAWLLELRGTLSPESIAGYVRGLKAELHRLMAIAEPRERALVLLLLDTGLRLAEVAALRVGDLRPDGSVRVIGKGSSERIVPIGATARAALLRYVRERESVGPADPVFVGRKGRLGQRGIQVAIRRFGRRAGVATRSSPHTFRHTFARGYLVNGGDVFSLQQVLGHATLDMVRRYISLTEADLVARHRTASPADRLSRRVAAQS